MRKKAVNLRKFTENVILSIAAQLISMSVGIVLSLVVPKYVTELAYSNWQVYVLYSSYVGLLHFGLLDGIVLRYSQYDYDEIDKRVLRSQFKIMLAITSILSIAVSSIAIIQFNGSNKIIFIYVAISIIIKNVYTYTSYTFQITNRIKQYALFIITDRLLYGLFVVILLLLGVGDFQYYCLADIASDLLAVIISRKFNKGLYFDKSLDIKNAIAEAKVNISSGCKLLIANWSSSFLNGGSRMIIQWHWTQLIFGKISFAFSVSNLLLQFVNAISVVLFPTLKRLDSAELPKLYVSIRKVVNPLLFISLILYFPIAWILKLWLPNYSESLQYFGILFPMVIYASKVSLLTNNYFKAYRQEDQMLIINVICMIVGFGGYVICAYIMNSLVAVVLATMLIIMLRSIVSEIFISKTINSFFYRELFVEVVMTAAFIACVMLLSSVNGLIVYLLACIIYVIIHKEDLRLIKRYLELR